MAIQQLQHFHGALVTPSDTLTLQQQFSTHKRYSCVYVGVGGNVRVLTEGGDDVTFTNIPDGSFVPVHIKKVFATGTTASSIIAVDMSLPEGVTCYTTESWELITPVVWEGWDTHWNDCNK